MTGLKLHELPKAHVVAEASTVEKLNLGVWNQILPVQNHNTGTIISTGLAAVDPSINQAVLRMDVPMTGVPHPFNNPTLAVRVDAWASWDGGQTLYQIYSQDGNGSFTGIWGKGQTYPTWGLDTPVSSAVPGVPDGTRASHYRADFTVVSGPINFGLSILPS